MDEVCSSRAKLVLPIDLSSDTIQSVRVERGVCNLKSSTAISRLHTPQNKNKKRGKDYERRKQCQKP